MSEQFRELKSITPLLLQNGPMYTR
jgi:hypothetical protein